MKTIKLTLIISALVISGFAKAQQKINNPELLKSELDTISKQKLPVNSVAVNQNGDWIILYGDIGYSFISMPEKLSEKLENLNKKQVPVKDIDFTGKSGWLLLAAGNAFYSDSIPEKLSAALKRINKQGKTITCFDNFKNAGVLLYGKNSFFQKGIPENLKKKLNQLKSRNQYIKCVALTKDEGWMVFYGKRGFSYFNIPVAVSVKVKELVQNGSSLDKIFFIREKWIVIYDNYKYTGNL